MCSYRQCGFRYRPALQIVCGRLLSGLNEVAHGVDSNWSIRLPCPLYTCCFYRSGIYAGGELNCVEKDCIKSFYIYVKKLCQGVFLNSDCSDVSQN